VLVSVARMLKFSCTLWEIVMLASILTIGYGNRSAEELFAVLSRERVQFLIDVRSNPVSRFNADFSAEQLSEKLRLSGIRYVPMGEALGGRPRDPSCYENGHVIYDRVQEKPFFKAGVDRLLSASTQGICVCLLCSELRPEDCHRSKLIGASLASRGVPVVHLGPHGEHLSQVEVIARLEAAQTELFGKGFRSRRAYRSAKKAFGS
jgi:uncharacterized protein (DUF488 family)